MVSLIKPGLKEGTYITWAKKWANKFTNDISSSNRFDAHIDEKNGVLMIVWNDGSNKNRLGLYKLADFSVVQESAAGSNYTYAYPNVSTKDGVYPGMVYLDYGGISTALQSYVLLMRADQHTIDVWRGGTAFLWSRDVHADLGSACNCYAGAISLTGRYIVVEVKQTSSPWDTYLILYEGT